ncbi:MAG: GNAT family N-acetyltransferase [Phycisphaeraceae bacterium]|nr:GNAT family N-acetyltransferase [Phycisphaeraceae bacterium]
MSSATTTREPVFQAEPITLRDGRGVMIRAAVPADTASLLRFVKQAMPDTSVFGLTQPDEFDKDEAGEREWIESHCSQPGSLALLAIAEGDVIGMMDCATRPNRRRSKHVAVMSVMLAKSYWGSGLGSRMLYSLVGWAERNPYLGLLELVVYANNERAVRLYTGCGFVKSGIVPRRVRFDDGTTRDDLHMFRRVDGTLSDQPGPNDFSAGLGDGVRLRQVRYGDAGRLYELYVGNRERMRPFFRWAPTVRSVGDVRGAIAEWIEWRDNDGKITCVVQEGDAIRGMVYMVRYQATDHKAELGYWVDDGQEGKGLVTRACRAMVRHLFEYQGVNRIDITADVLNKRSRAVAERLGFTHEATIKQWLKFPDGRFVDMANYRLLRDEWKNGGAK